MSAPKSLLRDGLVLALAAAATFARGIGHGFAADDFSVIRDSTRMRMFSSVWEVFVHPSTWIISDTSRSPLVTYRPLALSSMVIDNAIYAGAPSGFHFTNVLLHIGCVVVLWRLLLHVSNDAATAFALTLLFAVHPVGAEAITWINGRSEPLCLVFGLATLVACTRKGSLTWKSATGIAATISLSLLGKETGFAFLVLALGLLWRSGDREKLRTGSLALLAGALVYAIMRSVAVLGTVQKVEISDQIVAAIPALWFRALQVVLVPIDLGFENLPAWFHTTTPAQLVACVVLAAVFVSATLILWRRGRTLEALGLAWWLATLIPPSLTLATGLYWPGLCRWVYVALPGLLLALAPSLDRYGSHRLAYVAAPLLALLLMFESQRSVSLWRSDEALEQHLRARYPNSPYVPQTSSIQR